MRHVNIPIFIPHLGCPNQCVFCNQRYISGVFEFSLSDVQKNIDDALSTIDDSTEVEIAFFGGSFTGIDRELMLSLLDITRSYVSSGRVKSIRCSTRPDYISEEILDILKEYSVKTIELGIQSVSENVLLKSKRGHNFEAEMRACSLIKEYGFDLVGQMMIGLPGSTQLDEMKTAEFIISSGASAARIYPTVVFKNTELCDLTARGLYNPLTLDEAVERTAPILMRFIDAGLKVIRVGVCSSDNLRSDESYFAGPNHPALGELCESRIYYNAMKDLLSGVEIPEGCDIVFYVSRGALSKAIGQKRKNKILLENEFGRRIYFKECDEITKYEVSFEIKNGVR